MSSCYKCESPLNSSNQTEEHIIPNACGGRLKSRLLLCKNCNSKLGELYDAELARQTNVLALMLMIDRERGEPQPIRGKLKSTGEEYIVSKDGSPKAAKPIVELINNGEEAKLSITARDEREFKDILNGFKRKYPNLDIEEALRKAIRRKYYMDEPIKLDHSVGGEEAFKAVTKSAINYFIYNGGDRTFIKHLIPYLEGRINLQIVWFHYPDEIVYASEEDEVSNVIKVVGNPEGRILYAYIELFSTYKYIILLNDEYVGPALDSTYIYDLLKRKQLSTPIFLNYKRQTLLKLFEEKDLSFPSKLQSLLVKTLTLGDKIQTSYQTSKLLKEAIRKGFEKHLGATTFTETILKDVVNEIARDIAPFIIHKTKSKKQTNF